MEGNPIRPVTELTLSGKRYSLVYTHYWLSTAQNILQRAGEQIWLIGLRAKPFYEDLTVLLENELPSGDKIAELDVDQYKLGVLLWAGILHQSKMPLDEARQLITFQNAGEVSFAVLKALQEQLGGLTPDRPEEKQESPLSQSGNGGANGGPPPDSNSGSAPPDVQ